MVLRKWKSPLAEKYPTLSLPQLKNLNVPSIADKDCVLFLWATHTTLPDAMDLMKAWQFKYHCLLTWDKGNGWSI